MHIETDQELLEFRAKLKGSLLFFIQYFFKARTGRDFSLSHPKGRESHHITVCRELTKVFNLQTFRLIINLPPGHYKSTLLQHFVAWCWANYSDCQFLYLSYSHDEASKNTAVIKSIVALPQYRRLFGIEIDGDSSAKDNFKITGGGAIKAFGSGGAVTGKDAGFPDCGRYTGGLIMDDMHKPDEVHSDTMRESVIRNYNETIAQRVRGPNVSQIFLGQCLHEGDLAAYFKQSKDGYDWTKVVLMGLDEAGNALDENVKTKEQLVKMKEFNKYVFYAQYQQNPQPAGGSIFLEKEFKLVDEEPPLLATFITCDTAETDKDYNDPSVFSHWGLYEIMHRGVGSGMLGLHVIDVKQQWIEAKHLEDEFMDFYAGCLRHKTKPIYAGIEKKSTGVTLSGVLSGVQGLKVLQIERTRASGSKTVRFLEVQPYVASGRISLLSGGKLWYLKDNKPTNLFIEHMGKITANNTHAHDDIADTFYDAVKIGLIDKTLENLLQINQVTQQSVVSTIGRQFAQTQQLKRSAYG